MTSVEADASDQVWSVSVSYGKGEAKGRLRAYLMGDTYPAAWRDIEVSAASRPPAIGVDNPRVHATLPVSSGSKLT